MNVSSKHIHPMRFLSNHTFAKKLANNLAKRTPRGVMTEDDYSWFSNKLLTQMNNILETVS